MLKIECKVLWMSPWNIPAAKASVNSIYYQQLADNGELETYHRCNKKPLNTIKALHRLECLSRTSIVGKNEFLYHNNKEPLNPLHNVFFLRFSFNPQDARRRKTKGKNSLRFIFSFFSSLPPQSFFLVAVRDSGRAKSARLSLPI